MTTAPESLVPRAATEQNVSLEGRLDRRDKPSRAALEMLGKWIAGAYNHEASKSDLGKAMGEVRAWVLPRRAVRVAACVAGP